MNEHDLVRAARLHREHLPHGLFPSLGERFLRRYLRTYLNTPTAVALAIEGEHGMFGFLCGTVDRRAHREHVLRHHAASLVRGGVISLTSHPAVAMRFVRTRAWRYLIALLQVARRRRAEAPTAGAHGEASPAVLAHLVVTPQGRCAGAGAALVGAFEVVARERGLARAELLTLPGEAGAGRFYERLGWRSGELCSDRDGVSWVRYQKLLG
ncbi:MAG TPA: GNAT family N-acetyltransferase [Acidimicrobiales bacterium]